MYDRINKVNYNLWSRGTNNPGSSSGFAGGWEAEAEPLDNALYMTSTCRHI